MQLSVLLAALVSAAATSNSSCRAPDDGEHRTHCPCHCPRCAAIGTLHLTTVRGLALADVVDLDFFSAVLANNNLGGLGPDLEHAPGIRYQGARVLVLTSGQ